MSYGSISTDTAVDPHNLHWSLKVSGFKLFVLLNLCLFVFFFKQPFSPSFKQEHCSTFLTVLTVSVLTFYFVFKLFKPVLIVLIKKG